MKLSTEVVNHLKRYFATQPQVAVVFLYGSYAKGTADQESDIDLGILFNQKKSQPFASEESVVMQNLTSQLGLEVEVQDLEACSLEFAHRVLNEGQVIYSANEVKRVAFTESLLRDYFDRQPAREEYYSCLHQLAEKGELNARFSQN